MYSFVFFPFRLGFFYFQSSIYFFISYFCHDLLISFLYHHFHRSYKFCVSFYLVFFYCVITVHIFYSYIHLIFILLFGFTVILFHSQSCLTLYSIFISTVFTNVRFPPGFYFLFKVSFHLFFYPFFFFAI